MDYITIHWRCHVLYDQDFAHLSHLSIQNAFSRPVQMLPHLKNVLTSSGPPAQTLVIYLVVVYLFVNLTISSLPIGKMELMISNYED